MTSRLSSVSSTRRTGSVGFAPSVIVGARVVPSIKLSLAGSWFFEQTTEGTIGAKVSGGSIGPRVAG